MAWNVALPGEKRYELVSEGWPIGEGDPAVLDTTIKPVFDAYNNLPKSAAFLEHITQEWVNAFAPFVIPYGYGHREEYHGLYQRKIDLLNLEARQFFGLLAKLQWYRQNNILHLMKGWQVPIDDDLENNLCIDFNRKMFKERRHLSLRYVELQRHGNNYRAIFTEGYVSGIKAHLRDHMNVSVEEGRRARGEVWLDRTVSEFPEYRDPEQKHYYSSPTSPEAPLWDEKTAEETQWFNSALFGDVPIGTRTATISKASPVARETISVRLRDTAGPVDKKKRKYEWWGHSDADGSNPELLGVGSSLIVQDHDIGKHLCVRIYYISAEQYSLAVESPMTGAVVAAS